jgi:hypothetical protein
MGCEETGGSAQYVVLPFPSPLHTYYYFSFLLASSYGRTKAETNINGAITETTPFLWSGRNQVEVTKRAHVIKALLYAFQNFYAFMLM